VGAGRERLWSVHTPSFLFAECLYWWCCICSYRNLFSNLVH
jgi:hypothetical protein